MRLVVTDYVFKERRVDIPGICPECGAALDAEDALVEYSLEERGWLGTVVRYGGSPEVVEYSQHYSDPDVTRPVELCCAGCNHTLARGEDLEEKNARKAI